MRHKNLNRAATALLLAGVAFPLQMVAAQDSAPPVIDAPPPVTTTPAPTPPVINAPPPVAAPVPAPSLSTQPVTQPAAPATQPRAERTTTRSEPRPAPVRSRARSVSAAAEPAPAAAAPPAEAVAMPPAEAAAPPAPLALPPAPVEAPMLADASEAGSPTWTWLLAALGVAALGLFAWMLMRRRRRDDELIYEDEAYYHEPPAAPAKPDLAYFTPAAAAAALATPAVAQEPPMVAPTAAVAPAAMPLSGSESRTPAREAVASADRVSVGEPDPADVEALAAESRAPLGRPWIEFLMRPVRAGTTGDDAVVEFELTVGNTGSVSAEDVKISTWMFAAGSAAESEMERMLIEPPAEAKLSEISIPAGDGARVEASLALPKSALRDSVLPVVVADARYRLPDGSEGRTSASFEVGMPDGESLEPFPTDRSSGLLETIGARLHGDLERT